MTAMNKMATIRRNVCEPRLCPTENKPTARIKYRASRPAGESINLTLTLIVASSIDVFAAR
jgi:hypothetical protein